MSEFYVDADSLNGLYNLFVRAADDARDTLDYTKKHCDMPAASEGYLMMLIGPHKSAYNNLTGALTHSANLRRGLALKSTSRKEATHAPTTLLPLTSMSGIRVLEMLPTCAAH